MPDKPFDGVLITRPQAEADELAARLADLDLQLVIQPAFEFGAAEPPAGEIESLLQAARSGQSPLLVFTSTRALEFALPYLHVQDLQLCRLAAIGPATAAALQKLGMNSILPAGDGYTSEDLLLGLEDAGPLPEKAWIIAAAGGRKALLQGLREQGVGAGELLVYERRPIAVLETHDHQLQQAKRILSVWTSANAMQRLYEGLSANAWQNVCAGVWLVVSPRLAEIADGFRAAAVQVSDGPGNIELEYGIRKLCRPD